MKKTILHLLKTVQLFCCIVLPALATAQLTADFTSTPADGCAPLLVRFTDNSTGTPTSWNWDLGNGTFSSQQNPSVSYITPGLYTIKLTVSNAAGNNTITKTEYIKVYDKPVVNFTVNDSADCIPFVTRFTDLSTGSFGSSITAWEWDFDDGPLVREQNPQHQFNIPGSYNVSLKVTTNAGCFNVLNKLAYITAGDSLRSHFGFTQPVQCRPPETITFYNTTQGTGNLNYLWDFGDGNTSSEQSPSHTYTTSGNFSVQLITNNNAGCADTLLLNDTINIRSSQALILGNDSVCKGTEAQFTNGTLPAALTSQWIFSDGTTDFGTTVSKTWNQPGIHTVKLLSNSSYCSDSATKQVVVTQNNSFDFTVSDSASCQVPFTVTFSDLSTGSVEWKWYFDNEDTTTEQTPTYTYTAEGLYSVRMIVKDNAGCIGNISKRHYISVAKPIVSFDYGEGGGCIPYTFQPVANVTAVDGIAGYLWDFGDGTTSTDQSPSHIYTDTGRYTVKLVITSTDGCVDSSVVQEAVKTGTPPTVDFTAVPRIICPGTAIAFTDLSTNVDKWLWQFAEGSISTEQNPVQQFFDTIPQHVKLTVWNNGCKDSLTKNDYIQVLPGRARFRPVFNCTNKKQVYFKDSSIAAQNWFWNFGDGATSTEQNPTHTFSNNQPYTITLTTTNDSCSNTDSVTINIFDEHPDFTALSTTVCKNSPVTFNMIGQNANYIQTYQWNFGDGNVDSTTADSIIHTYIEPGSNTVSLFTTDEHGCTNTNLKTGYIQVQGPDAGFTVTNGVGCTNQTIYFIDSANSSIKEWHWNFGDGTLLNYSDTTQNPVTHTYQSRGLYYPSLKIIDDAGCADSVNYFTPVTITQPVVNFIAANAISCTNDTLQLQNGTTGTGVTYWWSFGDNTFSTDSLPVKLYITEGDFNIKLVATDANGCKDSLERADYMKVKDVTASFTTRDTIGLCIPFRASFTNNSVNASSQVWDFGDGGFSSSSNPSYYYSQPGVYYARLTAKRSNTCYQTDSVRIRINAPSGILNYQSQNGCAPLNMVFSVTTNDKVSYLWDFNDGTSYESNDSAVSYTYNLPGSFIPRVILKDSLGCAVPLFSADTIRLYNTKVDFDAADSAVCIGELIQFRDSSFSGSPVISYRWDFGDGNTSVAANPFHRYNLPGQYTVKLIMATTFGCQDSMVKQNFITVNDKPKISITPDNNNFCGPAAVQLNATVIGNAADIIQWHWNAGNGIESNVQNTILQLTDTGNHVITLTATNTNGCTDSAVTNIFIKSLPNIYAGADTVICSGSTALLTATGAESYSWLSPLVNCSTCASTDAIINNDIYIAVTGRSNEGCEKTDSIYIRVKKPFTLSGVNNFAICNGKTAQLNITGGEKYTWAPAAGLSNISVNNPVARPGVSTSYTVTASDSLNCFTATAVVNIDVYNQPVLNAGADILLTAGNSVTITPQYSQDITSYTWTPQRGLSCYDCATPTVTAAASTTNYTLQVANPGGCTISDEIKVIVTCDNSIIKMPNAFSPNNDGLNDIFHPLGTGNTKVSVFKIFNRYGQLIFLSGNFLVTDKSAGWDGRYKGQDQPAGTYVYSVEYVCTNNEVNTINGTVSLIR